MKTTLSIALLGTVLLSACGGGGGGGASQLVTPSGSSDPLYSRQWHLKNTGQEGGTPGIDINVEPVWQAGNEGAGVTVAVVDDGLEIGHEDLAANVLTGQSLNMAANGLAANNPSPTSDYDDHGTAVAGLIAAARNTVGGRGVAPQSKLLGVNVLVAATSDINDATALLHGKSIVAVSNNSWGNTDGDNELGPAGPLFRAAVQQGALTERAGKGIVFLFAAGNGYQLRQPDGSLLATAQRSSYDGFNNTAYALNIAAVRADGTPSEYSEPGANVLVSAPSDTFDINLPWLYTTAITGSYAGTTYMGQPWLFANYKNDFGGTSGATPVAAGVVALMLSANPSLGWRDVRWILAQTARRVNDSTENGTAAVGHGSYSHRTGFGLVDASAAVAMAKTHSLLPAMQSCTINLTSSAVSPAGGAINLSQGAANCNISRLESADLSIQLSSDTDAAPLDIALTSPLGRVSTLATPHSCYTRSFTDRIYRPTSCGNRYDDWTFHSVRHMGESPAGNWQLRISGLQAGNRLLGSQLVLRGH